MAALRSDPTVVCTACGREIRSGPTSGKAWTCPACAGVHPNLRFHWRLIGLAAGGLPLVLSLVGVLVGLLLPLVTGGPVSVPDWLSPAALPLSASGGMWHAAATFAIANALPALILVSALTMPRPWNDKVLKALVLAWLALVVVASAVRAWEAHSILHFSLTAAWAAAVLLYFGWLWRKTREMVRRPRGQLAAARRPAHVPRGVSTEPRSPSPHAGAQAHTPIERRIAALRDRVRLLTAVYGVSWVAGAVIVAFLALGLADYLTRLHDPGLRVISSLAVLGVLAWTCYRYLYLGLTVPLGNVELARRLQRRFPSLGDGLSSAVEFLGQPEDDPTAGSVGLRRAVIAEASAAIDPLDFHLAIEPAPVRRAALSTLVIFLAALGVVVVNPLSSGIAMARLVNPFSRAAWPQTHRLTVLDPVSRIARGQVFEIEVVDETGARLPPDVRVYYRFENPDGAMALESEPARFIDGKIAARREDGSVDPRRQNGVMLARRENVTRDFSYRVTGGDDRSMPWIPVEVLEPPALESLSITLTPPEYTGWPPEKTERQIRALVGTRVQLTGRSTKPLRSAVLCLEGGTKIEARLSGEDHRDLSAEFVVEESGAYWIQLTGAEGLDGGSDARWDIRAVPDAPPTVVIEQPSASVFVTPQAVVPVRVAAKDDLAVHRVGMAFTRSDRPEEAEATVPLYDGPERVKPQAGGFSGDAELGQNLVLPPYSWQLSGLGLTPGTQVTFHATAVDYRPNSGTSEPRRLVVITPEELTERITARQASILAELSRVLEMQKQSRGQVADLEIRLGEVGDLDQLDLDHLRGAELNQRQVSQTLTSRTDGVPTLILGLLADLENNKVDSPDVRRQMQALLDEIGRLEREQLPVIGRELTSAIKTAQVRLQERPAKETPGGAKEQSRPPQPEPAKAEPAKPQPAKPDAALVDPLAAAGKHQDQVIASLAQMLDQLGEWDRYRRFHAMISQLVRGEEELRENTKQLGSRTLTKDPRDLLPQESADLKILARRQFDLARDLDEIQQAMERASGQLSETNPLVAETISDALHRARELAVSGQMRSAAAGIQQNQMGQAIGQQGQIIDALREILDILANRRENELERLVDQLRAAESELAEMAQKQEGLKRQIDEAEALADQAERRRQLEKLARQQAELKEDAERMGRRLERLMADAASQTTSQAAQKMDQAAQSAQQGNCPGASKQAAGAKQDLDEARRQVAQRRLETEVQLALEQLARLEEALQAMHGRQEAVITETQRLDKLTQDQGQLTRAQAASLHQLARDQGLLQTETVALAEKLVGADVFNLALSGTAREMGRAAAMLDRRQTGSPTQQAEQNALRRLDQLLEALKPEEPGESEQNAGNSGAGQGGEPGSGQPPGSGLHTLVELKLLKLMQQEINHRTQELEQAFGQADSLPDDARREYSQLSEEQGRLAELLLGLIQPQEAPEENPGPLPGGPPDGPQNDPRIPLEEGSP